MKVEYYKELIKQHPFLESVVKHAEILSKSDNRNLDNSFEEYFLACLQTLNISKENKLC